MSNFFKTSDVEMFPSAYRAQATKGKYTSEENFVNIINSVVDKDCYVLSTLSTLENNKPLQVVLHGYYFEIKGFSLSNFPTLYVAIKVEQGANAIVNFDTTSTTDTQIDVNNDFTGLAQSTSPFTVTDTKDYKYYTLQVSQGGSLVNQVRLSSNSIYFKGDPTKNLSSLLDGKQDDLTAGQGIDSDELANNKIALTDEFNKTLVSFTGGKGSAIKPVYVNQQGEIVGLTSSSGLAQTSGSSNNVSYKYTQAALITDGNLMSGDTNGGVAFYASEGDPQSNVGKNGDFWFKYTA